MNEYSIEELYTAAERLIDYYTAGMDVPSELRTSAINAQVKHWQVYGYDEALGRALTDRRVGSQSHSHAYYGVLAPEARWLLESQGYLTRTQVIIE
jgi:hypothetical protein